MNKDEHIIDMDKMSPAAFRNLDRDYTVAVISFGPIEYHGDHLPLGTDYILASDMFRITAEKFIATHPEWKFVFLPVIPLGADTVPHGGSLWVNKETIASIAEQLARRLISYNFKYIALCSGHGGYGQVLALEDVSRKLRRINFHKKTMVFSPMTYLFQKTATQEFIDLLNAGLSRNIDDEDLRQMTYESHGGRIESSYILSVAPELMDDTYKFAKSYEPDPGAVLSAILDVISTLMPGSGKDEKKYGVKALGSAMAWFFTGAKNGYMGHPSRADVEFGNAFRDAVATVLNDLLDEILIAQSMPHIGEEFYIALRLLSR
jgi:creatinine amidohydrolase/Fe(II)-dependent formamide hydrolase-like protein